jgi:hypothetical protein
VLLQYFRSNLRVLLHELEYGVLGDLRAGRGIVHKSLESRIRLAQNSVTVSGHDSAGFQGRPEVVRDIFVGKFGSDVLLHLEDPSQDFLCSKSIDG